jgi:hypothetical protein
MQISYVNKATYANTTVSSYLTGYATDSLYDVRLSKLFKFSGITSCWLKVSGSAITLDRLYIAKHNFTSAVVITLEGNDTNVWTSPSFQETVSYQENIIYHDFTSATYNYWRVTIEDGTNTASALYIGYFFIGEYFQMPGMSPDQMLDIETTSQVAVSASGQIYGDTGYEFRNPTINFITLSNNQRLDLIDMFKVTRNVYPFFMAIWNNNKDIEEVLYCALDQNKLNFKKSGDINNPHSITLKFRECF